MKWIIFFIVLLMGAEAYYGYQYFQQKEADDQKQLTDLKEKVDSITAYEKKLQDENTRLTLSSTDVKTVVADLTKQLQAAQLAASQAQAKLAAVTSPPSAPAAPAKPKLATKLGTITAIDGKTYTNCQLLKVQSSGIVIGCDTGITELNYNVLPAVLQKQFGYDPAHGALTDDQVLALEQLRQASAMDGQ